MGYPWLAASVNSRGEVVGELYVKAGEGLIHLLKTEEAYREFTPYDTSTATVKEWSSLAVSCVDWERGLRLGEEVVEGKNRVASGARNRLWTLRRGADTHWRELSVRAFVGNDRPALPPVEEFQSTCEGVDGDGEEWVKLVIGERDAAVGVFRSLDILTNVVESDPRRVRLLRLDGRLERDGAIVEHGHYIKVALPDRYVHPRTSVLDLHMRALRDDWCLMALVQGGGVRG